MNLLRWFSSQTVREACAVHKHYRRLLAAQRDIMAPNAISSVEVALTALRTAVDSGSNKGAIRLKAEELQFAAEKWIKPYPNAAWRENVEVLLVALAVAMAIRTFFLQPFKIPTGSMQPTLFGVTSTPDFTKINFADENRERIQAQINDQIATRDALVFPTGLAWLKECMAGNTYLHVVAQNDGELDAILPPVRFLIFNIKQDIIIGGHAQTIWFPPDYGEIPLQYRAGLQVRNDFQPGAQLKKGDDVIKMKVSSGDHLFVDRLSYNFHRPERGDIIVFETQGIDPDQRSRWNIPADEFYIKRLIGLPGESISIGNDRHVRINGERLDASTPHFANVYGFDPKTPPRESQWSGHLNAAVAQQYGIRNVNNLPVFPDEQTVYHIPAEGCMPMGDNTCNSLDSRFWGAIPEKYVIGKYFFVYWPLTKRFGWGNE